MGKALNFLKYFFLLIAAIGVAILIAFCVKRGIERKRQISLMNDFEQRLSVIKDNGLDDHHYVGLSKNEIDSDMKYLKGETVAIVTLERLGIKVAVSEGIDKDTLHVSAGHFMDSDMPGEGNFAIAGHSSMVYTCLFNDLHNAVIGDEIKVVAQNGVHRYMVTEMNVVPPSQLDVLKHENESVLTIVTCTNSGSKRLVIRGIEITDAEDSPYA